MVSVLQMKSLFFSYETLYTSLYVLREFIIPIIFKRQPKDPEELASCLASVKGHNIAKASIETAMWDLWARGREIPLYQFLGGTKIEIPVSATLGIENTLEELLQKIEMALSQGYKRITIKIKSGWDYDILEEVRKHYPNIPLAVDGYSSYSLDNVEELKKLDEFGLTMIEDPLETMAFVEYGELQKQIITPICLDESINSIHSAKAALSMGSCKIIKVKLHNLGGLGEARKLHNICLEKNILSFVGNMMETGIGCAHNIALGTLSNFTMASNIPITGDYLEEDLITPAFTLNASGNMEPIDEPGIGVSINEDGLSRFLEKKEVFL